MTTNERALLLYLADLASYQLAEPAAPAMTAREKRGELAALIGMVKRDAAGCGAAFDGTDGAD